MRGELKHYSFIHTHTRTHILFKCRAYLYLCIYVHLAVTGLTRGCEISLIHVYSLELLTAMKVTLS